MSAVWVLYAVALASIAGLFAEQGPTALLLVLAMGSMAAACVLLAREAVRP